MFFSACLCGQFSFPVHVFYFTYLNKIATIRIEGRGYIAQLGEMQSQQIIHVISISIFLFSEPIFQLL